MFIPYRLLVSNMQTSTPEPQARRIEITCDACGGSSFSAVVKRGPLGSHIILQCVNASLQSPACYHSTHTSTLKE